jgi:exoribonuclease R
MQYKIKVDDRNYESFRLYNARTLDILEKKIENPEKKKLFHQDIFEINDNGTMKILHSIVRSMKNIPGVLVLDTKKKYGKHKNKFLYKLIPDDKRLPEFLVPYKLRITFEKKKYNKYVVFRFNHWNDKHPRAQIDQILGNVNILDSFYEYQLYCKSLYASNQDFTKDTMRKLKNRSEKEFIDTIIKKYNHEDRRSWEVFTIDPTNSKDFDDAFSISDDKDNIFISIYISNVSFWMDALELWDSFSERISTIYLPNIKRPMLPTILSDAICSLQEGYDRFAFTLDLLFDKNTYLLKNYTLKNTCINVVKNYRYETPELLVNKSYKLLFTFVRNINSRKMYVDNINTSHDVIAYLMIYMNYMCAKKMADYKIGIFRCAELKEDFKCPGNVSPSIGKFLKNWNSYGGKYTKYKNQKSHEILKLESYIHITSPIRRLVDLLNIIVLQNSLGIMKYSEKSKDFYERWTSDEKIQYINKTMRSIRKVQNKCELLRICVEENADMKKIYKGFIFDKIERNDGLYQYMVYLPIIKMVNRFTSRHDKENLTNQKFKLFIFTDETSFKKKIRVEIMNGKV